MKLLAMLFAIIALVEFQFKKAKASKASPSYHWILCQRQDEQNSCNHWKFYAEMLYNTAGIYLQVILMFVTQLKKLIRNIYMIYIYIYILFWFCFCLITRLLEFICSGVLAIKIRSICFIYAVVWLSSHT